MLDDGAIGRDDRDTRVVLFRDVRRLTVFSAARERDLDRPRARGDGAARNELIQHNLRLVISVVKRHRGFGLPFLDLIQEVYLGLSRAVDKFDYRLEYKFSICATYWIR